MSNDKVEATFHGARWSVIDMPGHPHAFAVAIVEDESGHPVHTHPIGFTDVREAHRAAARLNARDAAE